MDRRLAGLAQAGTRRQRCAYVPAGLCGRVAEAVARSAFVVAARQLLMLQEYFRVDTARGIVRMEFLGGRLLYAMRVVSNGAFNLCPSETCNPEGGGASPCEIPAQTPAKPVEFFPYADVPAAAVEMGEKIMASGGLDVGGIEYLEARDGRRIFYDVNANSNLRAPIGQAFGFDPFERVAEFLIAQ